MKPRKWWKSKS